EEWQREEEEAQRKRHRVGSASAPSAAAAAEGAADDNSQERSLRAELAKVLEEKRLASEAEDFDAAHAAKERESRLLARLGELGAPGGGAPEPAAGSPDPQAEVRAAEAELEAARADKRAAIQREDPGTTTRPTTRRGGRASCWRGWTGSGPARAGARRRLPPGGRRWRRRARAGARLEARGGGVRGPGDFDAAQALKAREDALLRELQSLQAGPPAAEAGAQRRRLEAQLAGLRERRRPRP
ncbi:unnamed protein product, partial [Prorocentrum cordatum]